MYVCVCHCMAVDWVADMYCRQVKRCVAPAKPEPLPWEITEAMRQAVSTQELLEIVFAHEIRLNAIHVTAAATRLADLGCSGEDDHILRLLDFVQERAATLEARGVANTLWAMGKLSQRGGSTREACLSVACALELQLQAHIGSFSAQHISNCMWALAVLDGCSRNPATQAALLRAAQRRMSAMTPQGASNIIWICARLGLRPSESWLADFFAVSRQSRMIWPGQSVANMMWALATIGSPLPRRLAVAVHAVVLARAQTFDSQAISNIVWSMAVSSKGEYRRFFWDKNKQCFYLFISL